MSGLEVVLVAGWVVSLVAVLVLGARVIAEVRAEAEGERREHLERWERLLESRRAELEELRGRHERGLGALRAEHRAVVEALEARHAEEVTRLLDRVQAPSLAQLQFAQALGEEPVRGEGGEMERELPVDGDLLFVDHFQLRGDG